MQMLTQARHQTQEPASVIEVFHQVSIATWAHIGDHWNRPTVAIKIIQTNVAACAFGLRNQVNDGVGRTTHRHGNHNSVFESSVRQNL